MQCSQKLFLCYLRGDVVKYCVNYKKVFGSNLNRILFPVLLFKFCISQCKIGNRMCNCRDTYKILLSLKHQYVTLVTLKLFCQSIYHRLIFRPNISTLYCCFALCWNLVSAYLRSVAALNPLQLLLSVACCHLTHYPADRSIKMVERSRVNDPLSVKDVCNARL